MSSEAFLRSGIWGRNWDLAGGDQLVAKSFASGRELLDDPGVVIVVFRRPKTLND